jgi:hypothetical protein
MKKPRKQREPSQASLREMPEVDFSKGEVLRNPHAARIAKEGYFLPDGRHIMPLPRRGRPKKGEGPGPTTPRSVRFPIAVWERVEKKAKAKGLSLHAAIRTAIIEWVGRNELR